MSMLNGQELFCFLSDSRLTRPTEDNWESLKYLTKVFLDCWLTGYEIQFEELVADQIGLVVLCPELENKVIFEFVYRPDDEFSLQIRWYDEEGDDWEEDRYNITWAKEDTGLPGDTD